MELAELETDFFEAVELARGLTIIDSEYYLNDAIKAGKQILAEGAQGSMLDVDFGTYPFVTSSTTLVAGACTGLGVAPRHINKVFGIFKAYATRVGSGPFPTELENEVGARIRKSGNEFGSTTGRPRRCGWLDLPALKYSIMLNGVTELHMMKADVLDEFDEIAVCTHYQHAQTGLSDHFPFSLETEDIIPVYKSFAGWKQNLSSDLSGKLPAPFEAYIDYLEKELEVPIRIISVGPDRKHTIIRNLTAVTA